MRSIPSLLIAFLLLCIFNSQGIAQSIHEPELWCYGSCSENQLKIWDEFQNAKFDDQQTEERLYSGECFHSVKELNKDHPHHAVFYFSRVPEPKVDFPLHASGSFQFFGKGYSEMTLEQAQQRFHRHTEPTRQLIALSLSYLSDFSVEEDIVRYWFRHSTDGQSLYLFGQWGHFHRIFCDLKRHSQ